MVRWTAALALLHVDAFAEDCVVGEDESSMLQMPITENTLQAANDASECRCPAYFKQECEAEEAYGCVWTAVGSSNGPWCQCREILEPGWQAPPRPVTPPVHPPSPPPSPPPVALPVQASWDNHFAAFGGQNVDSILLDYTEQSVITVYDQTTGTNTVYEGLAGVRTCFEGLFASLFDTSDLAAPVVTVTEATAHEPGSVLLIWRAPASGYSEATDTFIFDSSAKILWQNVVVSYLDPRGDGSIVRQDDTESPTGSGPVHDGWTNHFAAFGGQDVERVLLDYVEESVVTVYNEADGTSTTYRGLAGVRSCFEGLFASLWDTSDLAAPIVHVEEAVGDKAGQVLLIWSARASGYHRATDTFLFNDQGKITRQHVVVHYLPVQASWENHFAAFGGQDVTKILRDYSEQSVITVYDQTTGTNTVYEGLAGVRTCFEGLFASLFDISDLAAPVITVNEASTTEPGSVFLIWRAPASGYSEATDTFIFDSSSKIIAQNVVVSYLDPRGDGSIVRQDDTEVPTGSGPVHDGWANHFAAFGGQDVDQILLDYVEESEITVFNELDGSSTIYTGLAGVRTCFEGLFESLSDTSDLAAPIQHVAEDTGDGSGQVFLIWSCVASGYQRATDSFIFNMEGKITRQHVVVHHTPPALFVQLEYGAANCPPGDRIETYEECEAAHVHLGLEIDPVWTGTHGSIPGSCSTREEDWGGGHHFHWNNQAVGVVRVDLAPVCRAPSYVQLAYGEANCADGKRIETYEECEAAHVHLGLEISPVWSGTHGGIPGSCSTREEDWGGGHHFHWNNQAVGVVRADLAPVCRA